MGETTQRLRRLSFEPGQGKTITLATACSVILATGSLLTWGRPLLKGWINEANAADVQTKIDDAIEKAKADNAAQLAQAKVDIQRNTTAQLAPVVASQRLQLKNSIASLKRDITRMEYRRDRHLQWTLQDAVDLIDKQATLEESQAALAAFDTAKAQQ